MNLKQHAASRALEYVKDGMILGLGTGSTSRQFVQLLGERVQSGALTNIRGVPTSQATAQLAHSLGIPLVPLAEVGRLDLAVDGADEVDPQLNMIKGLGKAALREKMVEAHADELVIMVDDSKLVERLGRGPLPVEIVQFEAEVTIRWLGSLCERAELWLDERREPYLTDNGNYLVRCWFNDGGEAGIADAYALAHTLAMRPGVVEHGLFLDMATRVIVAGEDGIRILER